MLPSCYSVFMPQPVKLSDDLVMDARVTGDLAQRSIAGQVEFWARLGRAVESLMRADHVLALKRRGDERPLSKCLELAETAEGRELLAAHLAARPFPHFEAAVEQPGVLIKIDEDGTRTAGRFVNRVFVPTARG